MPAASHTPPAAAAIVHSVVGVIGGTDQPIGVTSTLNELHYPIAQEEETSFLLIKECGGSNVHLAIGEQGFLGDIATLYGDLVSNRPYVFCCNCETDPCQRRAFCRCGGNGDVCVHSNRYPEYVVHTLPVHLQWAAMQE